MSPYECDTVAHVARLERERRVRRAELLGPLAVTTPRPRFVARLLAAFDRGAGRREEERRRGQASVRRREAFEGW
ncbi:MAG: hypothetical protein IT304_11495 [Dehalococcoidia bacterium]|nr:hypothetical protein [Dehalococcoidia bacterium]